MYLCKKTNGMHKLLKMTPPPEIKTKTVAKWIFINNKKVTINSCITSTKKKGCGLPIDERESIRNDAPKTNGKKV